MGKSCKCRQRRSQVLAVRWAPALGVVRSRPNPASSHNLFEMLQRTDTALRYTVALVALLNLCYFGVEFAVALVIGSVSLFADSIDFLEDATVNGLILVALGWNARRRSMVGMVLAAVLFAPAIATLWTAWQKLHVPVPPAPVPLSLAGLGALAINLYCAFRLARFRTHSGSLTRTAFLSARNDALANVAIIAAGLATAVTLSLLPDLIVGLGIFVLNLDAARQVYSAAREEHRAAPAKP
jgi:Co/Zn/Cd efflux system component